MFQLKFRIKQNVTDLELGKEKFMSLMDAVSLKLLHSIKDTVKTYLRFTERHGWNYRYTGSLARSFRRKWLLLSTEKIAVSIFSNAPQARILEVGGTITARRRALTVPLKGTPYPFNLINTDRLVRRGNLLFLGKVPIFVLKKSVHIPAYFYLARAIIRAKYAIRRTLSLELRKVL